MTVRSPSSGEPPKPDALRVLLRQAQRELSKEDPFIFGEYVFGYTAEPHHRQMVEFVLDRIDSEENGVLLAPRGASKSTWCNTILLSWIIAKRPDIRVGLFSQKDTKAFAMSSAIKWTISESDEFKEVFGDLRSPVKWTDAEWVRKDAKHASSKDRTMVAAGANSSSAVSKRFDLILCDDILDENNTYTLDQRDKFETWFWKTLKPTLAPNGSVIVIGTRWCEEDLYEKLMLANGWPSLVIPAITRDGGGSERSYWPSYWPLDRLYKEREDVGWDNFACSYLNDISGLREGTIFKREWYDYFDELPSDRTFVWTMGVDLASSEKERADYTARVTIAMDEQHEAWVLSTQQAKIEAGHREFVREGYAATPGISRIVIETNQHQSTLVQDLLRETLLPVIGRRADIDKRTRARAVAARYETHRIHHHRSLKGGELEAQEVNFPKGHDDLIDALGLAMDINALSGSMATLSGAPRSLLRPPDELQRLPEGRELVFITGKRVVPEYLIELLRGVDTPQYTFEEAVDHANQRRLRDYVNAQVSGFMAGR